MQHRFIHPATIATASPFRPTRTPIAVAPAVAMGALSAAATAEQWTTLPPAALFTDLHWSLAALCSLALLMAILARRLPLQHSAQRRPGSLHRVRTALHRLAFQASAGLAAFTCTLHTADNHAEHWLNQTLAPACEGVPLELSLRVVELPTLLDGQGRLTATLVPGQSAPCGRLPLTLSVGWTAHNARSPQSEVHWTPQPGEYWRMTLTLKRPIATLNFTGFDVHRHWMERGIGALGRVVPSPRAAPPLPLQSQQSVGSTAHTMAPDDTLPLRLERWRHTLAERMGDHLPAATYPYQGIVQGLAIGLQKPITPAQWNVLSATGTSHLVSISGMHVTLLAGWLAWLVHRIWIRVPALVLRIPAKTAAAVISVPIAVLYAGLAGWGIPAQRTVLALLLATALLVSQRQARPLDLLCIAAALLAMADPWRALSPGFLLSFGAVGVLVFSSAGRVRHQAHGYPRLHTWLNDHRVVFIGLLPLTVALFGQSSWASPLANTVAIAWMGLLTTPLALIGCLLDIGWLLRAAHASIAPLWWLLDTLAQAPWAWQPIATPPVWVTALSLVGGMLALMPAGLLVRTPGCLLVALPFIWPVQSPPPGAFELTVLDIGQGNSMSIRTAHHTLLVDAGNASSPRNDQGRMTVLPWLHRYGHRQWDAVLLSHNDSDHAGGMNSVLTDSQTKVLYANPPFSPEPAAAVGVQVQRPCIAGTEWTWDGVTFTVLYPDATDLATETEDNAISCVLRIQGQYGSALLPGDIGVEQEQKLLARHSGSLLRSDVVIVPHHGSNTSSDPEFIQTVQARHAVFQVGYRNRYGHPTAPVLQRWAGNGVHNLRTDQTGAIRFTFGQQGLVFQCARTERRRFWHLTPHAHHNGATSTGEALSD